MCSTVRSTSTIRSRFQFCSIRAKCSNCSLFMYCSPRRAMYGFTLRGPANRLAEAGDSPSPSSSFWAIRVSTSGRVSNLIGAAFSLLALGCSGLRRGSLTAAGLNDASFTAAGFWIAGFWIAGFWIAGFAITGLGVGLLGFTVTFDVAGDGLAFAGGLITFFGAAL